MFVEAIRRNLPTKDATDSEIQKAIVAFLSGALDRNGGRKERAERKSILKASSTESRGNLNHTVQSDHGVREFIIEKSFTNTN